MSFQIIYLETLPTKSNDFLLITRVPEVFVEASQRPGHGVCPDTLLDAVRLGEKVVGVSPAAAKEELLADSAAGVVEEPPQAGVAHSLHSGQVAFLVSPSAADAARKGGGEVALDGPAEFN